MDKKTEILKNIIYRLHDKMDIETIGMVCDEVALVLDPYDITDKCTEVAVTDGNGERVLKTYIATKRLEGLTENTLKRYWHADLELLKFLQKPIDEITPYDLRFFLSCKRENGVSNRSLEGLRGCYSAFFKWLDEEGFIQQNPCSLLKQIKYPKEIKKPFTSVEIEKIRRACVTKRDLALVDFFYATGCRVSEVVSLDRSDIDFERSECRVIGKGNKERVVYINPVALMHLSEYLESRNDRYGALFVGRYGRLTKDGIERILKRRGEDAGVENVHPHRFRRTLATNLLDRGMSIQDVAAILGHADIKTTQIYCYISQENVQSAYKRYGGAL